MVTFGMPAYVSPEMEEFDAVVETGFAASDDRMSLEAPDYINGFDF